MNNFLYLPFMKYLKILLLEDFKKVSKKIVIFFQYKFSFL